jgi:hypothetical protein
VEVTPDIAAKAKEILRSHPTAEYASEFPFTLSGRNYVARGQVRDNEDGDVRGPQGQHKGLHRVQRGLIKFR